MLCQAQKLIGIIAVLGASATVGCFPDPKFLTDDIAVTEITDDSDVVAGIDVFPADAGCQSPAECTHLAAPCLDPVCLGGTCATVPKVGACDDDNPCTSNDLCSGAVCRGTQYQCDDGITCTDDLCDGLGGCNYPVSNGYCQIGGICVKVGDTKADDPCRVCAGGQSWSANDGASCDDGDDCTSNDLCLSATCVGEPYVCDDQIACTVDACDGQGGCFESGIVPNTCFVDGECIADGGVTNDGCARCVGGHVQPHADGSECASGASCRGDGICKDGECEERVRCVDDDPCLIGACGPTNECAFATSVDSTDVLGLSNVWVRAQTGAPVADNMGIWSTGRVTGALNLERMQPASLGVQGLDFVTLGDRGVVLATYATDGAVAWYRKIDTDASEYAEVSHLHALDHLVVTGGASPNVDFNGLGQVPMVGPTSGGPNFLVSYGLTGNPNWIARFDGAEQSLGVRARGSNQSQLLVQLDQTRFEMAGSSSLFTVAPVSGSRMIIAIETDNQGKALVGRRLVRFDRTASPRILSGTEGSAFDGAVLGIDSTNASLFVGVSPTVTLPAASKRRVAIAVFDANGQTRWIREIVGTQDVVLSSLSTGNDGRVLVAVESTGGVVSVRSPETVLVESIAATTGVVIAFDSTGDSIRHLSFNTRLLGVAASANRPENFLLVPNQNILATQSPDATIVWSLPGVGDAVVVRTDLSLSPLDIVEIATDEASNAKVLVRDDSLFLAMPSTDGTPPLGAVHAPIRPLQSTPGRVILSLRRESCP